MFNNYTRKQLWTIATLETILWIGVGFFFGYIYPKHEDKHNTNEVVINTEDKDFIYDYISHCESNNDAEAVGDGGKSIGKFQIKKILFEDVMSEVFGIKNTTQEQYENFVKDPKKAKAFIAIVDQVNFRGKGLNYWTCYTESIKHIDELRNG